MFNTLFFYLYTLNNVQDFCSEGFQLAQWRCKKRYELPHLAQRGIDLITDDHTL